MDPSSLESIDSCSGKLDGLLEKLDQVVHRPARGKTYFKMLLSLGFMFLAAILGVHLIVTVPLAIIHGQVGLLTLFDGWLIAVCYRFSKRLSPYGAVHRLRKIRKPPIVLLRAFRDDKVKLRPEPFLSNPLKWLTTFTPPRSLEECIADKLSRFGPLVCIGRPGDVLPPAGFSRMWVGNADWKKVVKECLDVCQLVVLILGKINDNDDGLAWELSQVASMSHPENIIIVVPPAADEEILRRWHAFARLSNGRIPETTHDPHVIAVGFDEQWHPVFQKVDGRLFSYFHEGDYEVALNQLVGAKSEEVCSELLNEAAKWDRMGEWDKAIAIYEGILGDPIHRAFHSYAKQSLQAVQDKMSH